MSRVYQIIDESMVDFIREHYCTYEFWFNDNDSKYYVTFLNYELGDQLVSKNKLKRVQ